MPVAAPATPPRTHAPDRWAPLVEDTACAVLRTVSRAETARAIRTRVHAFRGLPSSSAANTLDAVAAHLNADTDALALLRNAAREVLDRRRPVLFHAAEEAAYHAAYACAEALLRPRADDAVRDALSRLHT